MKDRITKALAKCFCLNEFELNIKCDRPCPVKKCKVVGRLLLKNIT